ncbi:MAG: hypothetical protein FJ335_05685 [Sphingomonadales bacterium]|nr:hypothetical protein [Sphingomonadales bacterium]
MVGLRIAVSLALATAIAACSPQGAPRDPAAGGENAIDSEVAAVINIQDRTELQILKERVVTLEREIGELKANPQALDLELLTQRVQALEAGTNAATAPSAPTPARAPQIDSESAERAVDAAIAERRANRTKRD